MKALALHAALGAALLLGGCSTPKDAAPQPSRTAGRVIGNGPAAAALPRATVYKMAGPATAANVAIEMDQQGNIVSYPAPGDVAGLEPIALADGWLLDRRGISANSAFTRYTFKEYSALSAAPTPAELKASIIKGARAIDIHRLDMTPGEAAADTAAVNAIIRTF